MDAVSHFIHAYGLFGLFAFVCLESLGLPLPGETLIIAASIAAADGALNIYGVIGVATMAAIVGGSVGYFGGRAVGRPAIVKYGASVGIDHQRLLKVETVFRKRGILLIAISRFFVILRQLSGIAAGTIGMRWGPFILASSIGAALWVAFWATLAYRFGRSVTVLPELWHKLAVLPLSIIFGVLVVLLAFAAALYLRHAKGRGDGPNA